MCVGCMRVKKMNVEYKYVNLSLNSVKGGCVTNKILTELCVCVFFALLVVQNLFSYIVFYLS